jgi:single-strand DNA-binding protein
MEYLNKCEFIGRVRRNPEKRRLEKNGSTRTTFSIEVVKPYRDEHTGELKTANQWIHCAAWRELGDSAYKGLQHGDEVFIQGHLRTRSHEKGGTKVFHTEIHLTEFQVLKTNKS